MSLYTTVIYLNLNVGYFYTIRTQNDNILYPGSRTHSRRATDQSIYLFNTQCSTKFKDGSFHTWYFLMFEDGEFKFYFCVRKYTNMYCVVYNYMEICLIKINISYIIILSG